LFVTSEAEFDALPANEIADYNHIIVIAELQWDGKKLTDFYGIDIAVRIRLEKKAPLPMCILSFMPKVFFINKNEAKYNVLEVRGSAFIQLPCSIDITDKISEVQPLSQAALAFMPLYLIEVKNLIAKINHDLRISSNIDKIERTLAKIDMLPEAIGNSLIGIVDKIKQAHSTKNIGDFEDAIKVLVDKLSALQEKEVKTEEKKVKILLLEDKKEERDWAISELNKYFEVKDFQDAALMIAEIDRDEKNNYRALICDWELLKENSSEHQDRYGFEVLEYASKKRFYALFSLTITDDYSIRDVDACLNIEHQIFKKEFEEEKSKALWNSYIPIIQQKVRQMTTLICSIPDCKNWTAVERRGKKVSSFESQYIEKRNSADWASVEEKITGRVNNYFKDNFKEIAEIGEDVESLLVARRIFYKLFFSRLKEGRNKKDTVELSIKDYGREYSGDSNRGKFLSDICLKFNDLPHVGMLPEEKAWLKTQDIYI